MFKKKKQQGESGRQSGHGDPGAGEFCVEGGTAFLLLIVSGARIPSPHC